MYVPPPPTVQTCSQPKKNKHLDEETARFHESISVGHGSVQTNAPGAELDLYLEEPNLILDEDNKFDILKWWSENLKRFPSLSKLVKVLLMVPMTSVASESAFSTGGRVIDDHRTRLNEDIIEALICTQDWIKADRAKTIKQRKRCQENTK
jgi:hypothetical protein